MKKINLLLVFCLTIIGLSNAFSQHVGPTNPFQKEKRITYKAINQHSKALIWQPDTVITYYSNALDEIYTFTYNEMGNMLTMLVKKSQGGTWENSKKDTYNYDNNEKMVSLLSQEWLNNEWKNTYRDAITYDVNGRMSVVITEKWVNEVWVNLSRLTYSYDEYGNMVVSIEEQWRNEAWGNLYKLSCTYDGTATHHLSFIDSWGNGIWNKTARITYFYDINYKMLSELLDLWVNNTWLVNSRHVYTYDDNENKIVDLAEKWISNGFVKDYRCSYGYDLNQNSTTGIFEKFVNELWVSEKGSINIYSEQTPLIDLHLNRYEAKFRSFNTGIASIPADVNISIYPNPATDQISISLSEYTHSTLEIFNIQGQLCHTQTLQSEKSEINIANLAAGLYLLKINTQNRTEVKKFIKK